MLSNQPRPYSPEEYKNVYSDPNNPKPSVQKDKVTKLGDHLSERHNRLLKKDDFIKLGRTAKVFKEIIQTYEFRPNLFWGEDRDILKEKPDLFTELIACLGFFHAIDNNLDNFYHNLGAVLINGGHINLFDDYHIITDKESPFRDAYLEFYNSIKESAEGIVKRNGSLDELDKESVCAYFYEYFLEAYDKQLRNDLGVWYTPDPIVTFINSSIRTLLADKFPNCKPWYFDFASGTGVFIIDTIRSEYYYQKDYMTPHALKWHLFNTSIASELNDMSFLILFYNVNKTVYSLLGEWNGQIPVIDPYRPYFLPILNSNTLSLDGGVPCFTHDKRRRLPPHEPN